MAPRRGQPPASPAPRCPICLGPIYSGDMVVFIHGDLLHVECRKSPGDTTERVAEFLRQRPEGTYCNICISTSCSIAHHDAVKATTQLRINPDFTLMLGERCTGCDQRRITIGVRRGRQVTDPPRG